MYSRTIACLLTLCTLSATHLQAGSVALYGVDPMKHDVLDGVRLPFSAEAVQALHVTATREIEQYHNAGKLALSYAHPFPGQEDAEIYRRNYGLALHRTGYDGAQIWVYQAQSTEMLFNDFSWGNYREMSFAIPITDGLVPTICWEGLREGVDDIRYLTTLLKQIELRKKGGRDVAKYESRLERMEVFNGDLTAIGNQIIQQILELQ